MMHAILDEIAEHQRIVSLICETMLSYIYTANVIVQEAISQRQTIYIFGNGLNALHVKNMVFLLNNKYQRTCAVSLSCESVLMSHIASEQGHEFIFEQQILRNARAGDVLIGFSTSGHSKSILRGLSVGKTMGCKTIGISTLDGGFLGEFCDVCLCIPSDNKFRIQEMYGIVTHLLI